MLKVEGLVGSWSRGDIWRKSALAPRPDHRDLPRDPDRFSRHPGEGRQDRLSFTGSDPDPQQRATRLLLFRSTSPPREACVDVRLNGMSDLPSGADMVSLPRHGC
jgi:hypothetical protein